MLSPLYIGSVRTLRERFWRGIRYHIAAQGRTQTDLAKEMGRNNRQIVQRLVNAPTNAKLDMVDDVAKALGVDPVELLRREPSSQEELFHDLLDWLLVNKVSPEAVWHSLRFLARDVHERTGLKPPDLDIGSAEVPLPKKGGETKREEASSGSSE